MESLKSLLAAKAALEDFLLPRSLGSQMEALRSKNSKAWQI